jgi:hypothetical protein
MGESSMTMIEAMAARRSTRTFSGEKMTEAEAAELSAMLAAINEMAGAESAGGKAEATSGRPPFGHEVRLAFHESGEGKGKPVKMGTYGLISGASTFIVPAVIPGLGAMEDVGYMLEKAVLEATAMGWATCWIGGVFSRSKAAEVVGLKPGELIPAVIALGKPAAGRSLADRIVTGTAKSRSRKPLEVLVFSVDGAALLESWLSAALALRDAPSASNKQPWRLVSVSGSDAWMIFLDEDKVYNNSLGEAHMQNLDIGIGMRHFQESIMSAGLTGRWVPLPDEKTSFKDGDMSAALNFGMVKGWRPIALWHY